MFETVAAKERSSITFRRKKARTKKVDKFNSVFGHQKDSWGYRNTILQRMDQRAAFGEEEEKLDSEKLVTWLRKSRKSMSVEEEKFTFDIPITSIVFDPG